MPQEVEVWYLLPAIRRELALRMIGKGARQKDVASLLGVTPAAVSQYMKSKRAKGVRFSEDVLKEIGKSAERIMKGCNPVEEIHRISVMCRKDRTLCRIHTSLSSVPKGCRICMGE